MSIRLLIADDSPLAREAIHATLAADPEFEIVGEARDGYEALELVRSLRPEMVLLDLNMPRCDGLLATRLIKRSAPEVIVVILTVSDDAADLFEAVRSGAQGYLVKSLDPKDWREYLHGFARRDYTLSRDLAQRMMAGLSSTNPEPEAAGAESGLTDREAEVLGLVARAMTNREIAETLGISEQTVKNHLKKIMQKLGVKNRVELAMQARRVGANGS